MELEQYEVSIFQSCYLLNTDDAFCVMNRDDDSVSFDGIIACAEMK